MKTIYQLQQIAARLRAVTEVNSISPEDTFGLQSDILEYLADMEHNVNGLGIHKVYGSAEEMEADGETPIGSDGKELRFGQLVAIYDGDNATQTGNGDVYTWQKGSEPRWRKIGNISDIDSLVTHIEELCAELESKMDSNRAEFDQGLNNVETAIDNLSANMESNRQEMNARIERSVSADELDTYFLEDKSKLADGSHCGIWKVTSANDHCVGIVEVMVDQMMHCMVQKLTTLNILDDGVLQTNNHEHKRHEYVRMYNLQWSSGTLPDGTSWPVNTWSKWEEWPAASIKENLEYLNSKASEMISSERVHKMLTGNDSGTWNGYGLMSPLKVRKFARSVGGSWKNVIEEFNGYINGLTGSSDMPRGFVMCDLEGLTVILMNLPRDYTNDSWVQIAWGVEMYKVGQHITLNMLSPSMSGGQMYRVYSEGVWSSWKPVPLDGSMFKTINGKSILAADGEGNIEIASSDISESDMAELKDYLCVKMSDMVRGRDADSYVGESTPNKVVEFSLDELKTDVACRKAFNLYIDSLKDDSYGYDATIAQNMITCVVNKKPVLVIHLSRTYSLGNWVQFAFGVTSDGNGGIIPGMSKNIMYRQCEDNTWGAWEAVGLSGSDLKTINGNSLVGQGDIVISGGTSEGGESVSGRNYNFALPMVSESSDNINYNVSIKDGGIGGEKIASGAISIDKLDADVVSLMEDSVNEENVGAIVDAKLANAGTTLSAGTMIELTDRVGDDGVKRTEVSVDTGRVKTLGGESLIGSGVGENIPLKTINGEALTGDGNIVVAVESAIKGVSLNGVPVPPNDEGIVPLKVDKITVDESLDSTSTNAVQNSVISQKVSELESRTVGSVEVVPNEDGSMNILTLYNTKGQIIDSAEFTGGSGVASDDITYMKVQTSVDKSMIKEGDSVVVTWDYNHLNADQEPDGVKADKVEITIMRGSSLTYSQTLTDVSAGRYTLHVSADMLLTGVCEIRVKATCNQTDGTVKTKTSYVSVNVVTLNLTSDYSIATAISGGGYGSGDTITIPFAITGSGTKEIMMYVDNDKTPTSQTITRSGTTNGQFTLPASSLAAGRHVIQLVAERDGLRSQSIYLDILVAGSNAPFIGAKFTFNDGRIQSDCMVPEVESEQYAALRFSYVCYDPSMPQAMVTETHGGVEKGSYVVDRSVQAYTNRFVDYGAVSMQLICGDTTYNINLNVAKSSLDISETVGAVLKLSAAGRNNGESNPAVWTDGGYATTFANVDWKSSGWTGETLHLMNGASAEIDIKPMSTDMSQTGKTIEVELMVSNVLDREGVVLDCMDGGKGLRLTTEKASMLTGNVTEIEDEEGNKTETPAGVEMNFASGQYFKIAFVVHPRSGNKLLELYVNGIRSKAYIYTSSDNFLQSNAKTMKISSDAANVDVKVIRVYDRALSDDEILMNYMVDRGDLNEMSQLAEDNDILGENGEVSVDKIRSKGHGVLIFEREGGLDPVNSTNNKKTDFLTNVYFYSPFGKEYDFVLKNCYMRIQGTSSTKYPRKNYRIYMAKGSEPELWVNGVQQGDKNKYRMREGAKPNNLYTLKCDYSDSSMTHNTGMAKLFNDVLKEIELLTPPQMLDSSVRSAIDGFPIDVFCRETSESDSSYYGQYNFNNEKSKSGELFGHVGVEGLSAECSFCLEFLNNTQKLCNFQVDGTGDVLEAQLQAEFDSAFEFNYPEDYFYNPANGAEAPAAMKQAMKDLLQWIYECMPKEADTAEYKDISSFKSQKFKNECAEHFDLDYLLNWYVFTDYFMMVDQRAKNQMLRTWDGKKFYITYYDGDTALGCRNDSYLAYDYKLNRDTWDTAMGKWAYEGHDSWLWCLVLANFEDELKAAANKLRSALTPERALKMFNVEQMGNWSARCYNKSGEFKYLKPQTEGVDVGGVLTKYNFVYALQGSREAHRTFTIQNRFALLDAKYNTNAFMSDNIDAYISRSSNDGADKVRVTGSELYYYGWGTNNATYESGIMAEADEEAVLTVSGAFTVNDPIRIYGASRMKRIDLSGISNRFKRELGLNKCLRLQELDMTATNGASSGWYLNIGNCTMLKRLLLNGQTGATTNEGGLEMDLSSHTRLEHVDLGGTKVLSVLLAEGAPVSRLVLPSTLSTLSLRYLGNLKDEGLTIEGYENITGLKYAECPGVDWKSLVTRCTSLERVRIDVGTVTDSADMLNRLSGKKGYASDGSLVDYPALTGMWYLSEYIDDALYDELKSKYPELTICQPSYTLVEFDDSVEDPANITNMDNNTGYRYGNSYVPSAHIAKILNERHRCLGKDKLIEEGNMVVCMLHDEDSNYYGDNAVLSKCSAANLTGSQGELWVYEPSYWYKGVNDILAKKKYGCFHYGDDKPREYQYTKIEAGSMTVYGGKALKMQSSLVGNDWNVGVEEVAESSIGKVSVGGYKYVRMPLVRSNSYGAAFVDANGNVMKMVRVADGYGYIDGMYVISAVPSGASSLVFTYLTKYADIVVLTNEAIYDADGNATNAISVMEPDAVYHKAQLVSMTLVSADGKSVMGGTLTAKTIDEYRTLVSSVGEFQKVMINNTQKDILNLSMLATGTRLSNTYYGNSNSVGIESTAFKSGMRRSYFNQNNNYVKLEDGSSINLRQLTNVMMGYINIKMQSKLIVDGIVSQNGVYTLEDGRMLDLSVLGSATGYVANVYFGRYMDLLPAEYGASTSTGYCDKAVAINMSSVKKLKSYYCSYETNDGLVYWSDYKLTEAGYVHKEYNGPIRIVELSEYKTM